VGKVEDLRKMREARYMMRHGMVAPGKKAQEAAKAITGSDLCGHKGVGGKSCTRPKDHPEKNHRYK